MNLTVQQHDAVTELLNIGYGRAAAALSVLTGFRVTLEVPKVSMHPISEIGMILNRTLEGPVACVNQIFGGPIAGNALLLMEEGSALALSQLLGEPEPAGRRFESGARDTITEVGNVVLNACLGVFGNLLQVHVTFAVPRIDVETLHSVLRSITVANQELRDALMIHTRFHLGASGVTGALVIVLSITSIDQMLRELDKWEERQDAGV